MGESPGRSVAAFGAGIALALYGSLLADAGEDLASPVLAPAGPVAWWAVDRDAQELCGLDEHLVIAKKLRIGWPLALRPREDGSAWLLRSVLGQASAPCRLDLLAVDGSIAVETGLGPCGAIARLAGGDAVAIEKGTGSAGADRLLCCDDSGRTRVLLETTGLSCASPAGDGLLAGTESGELFEWTSLAEGTRPARIVLGGPVVDLAAGPPPASTWVLYEEGGARVGLFDPGPVLRWSAATLERCARLARVRDEERVWIAGVDAGWVRRIGPGGTLELARGDLPFGGFDGVVAGADGGALAVTPGAILRLDASGRVLPGQGGFACLTELQPAAPVAE